MTRKEIIRMAIEAGLHDEMWFGPHTPPSYHDCLPLIERFAALVAATEREACANLCEDTTQEYEQYTGQPFALNHTCADAIRARGNT